MAVNKPRNLHRPPVPHFLPALVRPRPRCKASNPEQCESNNQHVAPAAHDTSLWGGVIELLGRACVMCVRVVEHTNTHDDVVVSGRLTAEIVSR
jgi:hypothetical protein